MDKSVLPPGWQVPEEFRKRLGAGVGRQRPMLADGHLLLVLHAPPQPEDPARVGRFFWRTPDGNWTSKELGTGIHSLNIHLDEYQDQLAILDRLEEEAHTAGAYFEVLERLTPLHRAARNLYQVLQEARTLCPDYRDLIDVRDRAYAIERTADLLFTGTKNALEFTVAQQSEVQAQASHRMASAAHRLNILAAFFFPVITLAAIFGVDLATVATVWGIDLENQVTKRLIPVFFLVVLACGLVLGGILTSYVSRTSRFSQDPEGAKPRHRTP